MSLPDFPDSVERLPVSDENPVPVSTGSLYACEAVVCKRAADGGKEEFRAILSDSDHIQLGGSHYHLHCAPPIVGGIVRPLEPPPRVENEFNQVAQDAQTEGETVDWLIDRVSSIVQEAPQAEREPLLYRAHVLGVLHQAKAMERIADYLESIQVSADQIVNAVSTLCAELVNPNPKMSEMAREIILNEEERWTASSTGRHEYVTQTGGGKACYLCGLAPNHECHQTATGPDAEPDPAEAMRRVEGGE